MILWATLGNALRAMQCHCFSVLITFPFGPTRLFLPLSRRDIPVGSLAKSFLSAGVGSGDEWCWQGSEKPSTSHVEQQQQTWALGCVLK